MKKLILLFVLFVSNAWAGNGTDIFIDFSNGWERWWPNSSGTAIVREIRKDKTTFCASFTDNMVAYHEINYDNGSTYRSESQRNEYAPVVGDERFGFRVFLPKTYVYDDMYEIIYQSAGPPDRADNGTLLEIWRSPALKIITKAGRYEVWVLGSAKKLNQAGDDFNGRKYFLGDYKTEVWTTFEVHVRWDWSGQGSLKIWQDKVLVLSAFPITIGFNDDKGTYPKIGLYKWRWSKEASSVTKRTIYHDDYWRVY